MKKITKYVANDGSEWNHEQDARDRDNLHAAVAQIMAPLGDIPQAVKDGKGWVQHDLETVNRAKDEIVELVKKELPDWVEDITHPGRDYHPGSLIGRLLDDHGGPLRDAWYRFHCIDLQGWEHQQPFFAYYGEPNDDQYCVEDRRLNSRKQ